MPIIQVVSSRSLAGKTAVASAVARALAAENRVRLVRAGSGAAADADAETFAGFLFASSPGMAASIETLTGFPENELVIIEPDAGEVPLGSEAALVAVRGMPTDADAELAIRLGERLIGTIGVDVPPLSTEDVARALTNANLRPLALIPEDRRLSAPSVDEIRQVLNAQVLFEGENPHEIVQDVLVGPVYADPARPHFRRFDSKAIMAPYNKTDLHLAAIETQAACLIITGAGDPSPYVLDRAQHGATTVLLAKDETPQTIAALGDVWSTSRFRGESKVEALHELLSARFDVKSLLRKIS